MTQGFDNWVKTLLALRLLRANPNGLKGLVIRARSGPIRDRLIDIIQNVAPALYKIYPNMSDEQLFGGLDLVQTLQQQKLVYAQGKHSVCALILHLAHRKKKEEKNIVFI